MGCNSESYLNKQEDNALSAINQSSEIILEVIIGTTIGTTVPAYVGSTTRNALKDTGITRGCMSKIAIRHSCYLI